MPKRIDAHFVAAGKYHDIDFARLEILKLLAEHPEIRTTVACDYSNIERLESCRFLITYCCDLMPTTDEMTAIKNWLNKGGKWLALHGTNSILKFVEGGVDTPDLRPDVMEVLGTQFKAHPPIGPFQVEVVNKEHPLSRDIEDFEIIDELYLSVTTADIDVLMQTNFEGDASGFVDNEWPKTDVPILYTRELGKGEIVYNTLGHCRGHYDLPEFREFNSIPDRCSWDFAVYYQLLRRSINWAKSEA